MGFFEKVQRFINGEPVFQPGDLPTEKDRYAEEPRAQSGHGIENAGGKNIPRIFIEDTDCHVSGSHMEVRSVIKNESGQQLEVDKIFILGIKREVDVHLRPHEARQMVLYSGFRPNHQNYGQADINYRTTEQPIDYFQLKCRVEFKPETDGTYSVRRITGQGPIKDIE